jgi:hypothetical protein
VYVIITKSDFNIFRVNLLTDATAIPLGWLLYASDDAWAEEARDLLTELAAYLPEHALIMMLGDRIHTGEPFLERLDELHWDYIFRAPSDTLIETRGSWKMLKQLTLKPNNGRFLKEVRVWKGHKRRTNVSGYKLARNGFRAVTWFVVSSLPVPFNASEKHRTLSLSTPPVPRVLDYQRTFGQFAHIHVMQ